MSYLVYYKYATTNLIIGFEVLFDEREIMLLLVGVTTFHFSRLAGVLG
jgi:hypothetical protein